MYHSNQTKLLNKIRSVPGNDTALLASWANPPFGANNQKSCSGAKDYIPAIGQEFENVVLLSSSDEELIDAVDSPDSKSKSKRYKEKKKYQHELSKRLLGIWTAGETPSRGKDSEITKKTTPEGDGPKFTKFYSKLDPCTRAELVNDLILKAERRKDPKKDYRKLSDPFDPCDPFWDFRPILV